ncbi:MAG: hypothetical protein NVSMB42_20000 [Herpetosiphon sp.]
MKNEPPKRPPTGRLRAILPEGSERASQALLPIVPASSVEAIIQQIRALRAPAVELLVPNDTRALQSVAGCDALREAAEAMGVRLTLFTGDEKTATAAALVNLDVVTVGSAIAAPTPGASDRTANRPRGRAPTQALWGQGAASAGTPIDNRQQPRPSAPSATAQLPSADGRHATGGTASSVGQRGGTPPSAPANAAATGDDEFLANLAAFEQAGHEATPHGRVIPTAGGSVLFDTPGDAGVPRKGREDQAWDDAFNAMGSTMAAEPAFEGAAAEGRATDGSRQSLFKRFRRGEDNEDDFTPPGEPVRLQRPPRSISEADARRQQSRKVLVGPLIGIVLIALLGGGYLFYTSFRGGVGGPILALTPPPGGGGGTVVKEIVVALSSDPVAQGQAAVQAKWVSTPVSVAVQGQATKQASMAVGFASGTVVLRNRSSQQIVVPAGEKVEINGMSFVFNRQVVVPPQDTTNPDVLVYGRAEGTLVATVPGSKGNLPAGTLTQLPKYGGNLQVDQHAFSGGEHADVLVVRLEDVNHVMPDAVSRLYTLGVQGLQRRAAEMQGANLPAAAISPTLEGLKQTVQQLPPEAINSQSGTAGVRVVVLPPLGSPVADGKFAVEVSTTFEGLATTGVTGQFTDQLKQAVRPQLSARQIDPASVIEILGWTHRDQHLAVDIAVQDAHRPGQFPAGFAEEVKQKIANKSRDEAEAYLQQLLADHKIAQMPTLQPGWQTIPANIKIVTTRS